MTADAIPLGAVSAHRRERAYADDVRRRVQRRRRRRQVIPAVSAVAVIGAGIVVTMRQNERDGTSTAVLDGSMNGVRPNVEIPGWSMVRAESTAPNPDPSLLAQVLVSGPTGQISSPSRSCRLGTTSRGRRSTSTE
jgi:hypothetical protein